MERQNEIVQLQAGDHDRNAKCHGKRPLSCLTAARGQQSQRGTERHVREKQQRENKYRPAVKKCKIGQKSQSRRYYAVLVVLREQEMKERLLVCYPWR